MLNPIPIQFLALLAYFILRFGVGIILIHLAIKLFTHRQAHALIVGGASTTVHRLSLQLLIVGKVLIGSLLLIGLYTQYAALALMIMCIDLMLGRSFIHNPLLPPKIFYALLLFAAISLFITGAGAFAVDLPL